MEERDDIRPSQEKKGAWVVIDTGNGNCPVKEFAGHSPTTNRASALRAAIRMDKGLTA